MPRGAVTSNPPPLLFFFPVKNAPMAANHLSFVVCCVGKAGGAIRGLGVAVGTDDIFSHDFGTSELLAVSLIRVAPCARRRRESHIRKKRQT